MRLTAELRHKLLVSLLQLQIHYTVILFTLQGLYINHIWHNMLSCLNKFGPWISEQAHKVNKVHKWIKNINFINDYSTDVLVPI